MVVPELDVTELSRSLQFYGGVLGFRVLFERTAERFAYLERDGVELMVQEAAGPGRRSGTSWSGARGSAVGRPSSVTYRRVQVEGAKMCR